MRMVGAVAVARTLEKAGIDLALGMCGHGNVALLDALLDTNIRFVSTYHEQVAAHAADAYFRIGGKPAVVITTAGAGATNVLTGLGDALLDASAVLVLAASTPQFELGLDALQELGLHGNSQQGEMFRPVSKRVIRVERAEHLPRAIMRALNIALSGCPGPVVLDIPLDLFSTYIDVEIPSAELHRASDQRFEGDATALARAAALLNGAKRPLIYAGGGVNRSRGSAALTALAEALDIPVVTSLSGRGAISEAHQLSAGFTGVVGHPVANALVREADVMLAVGTRFFDIDTSSWSPTLFAAIPPVKLIHIDVNPYEIGKIFPTECGIVGDAKAALAALVRLVGTNVSSDARNAWRSRIRSAKETWESEAAELRASEEMPMQIARILSDIRSVLPSNGIFVSGVGIRHVAGQHFPILEPDTYVVGSGFATMGQEPPAAIGAALAANGRPVIAVVGDGAFICALPMLATAVAEKLPAVWVVLNNGGYASIATYQAKHYKRFLGTRFESADSSPYSPNYVAIAKGFGASALRISSPGELLPAITSALSSRLPTVIEIPTSPISKTQVTGNWAVNDYIAAGAKAT